MMAAVLLQQPNIPQKNEAEAELVEEQGEAQGEANAEVATSAENENDGEKDQEKPESDQAPKNDETQEGNDVGAQDGGDKTDDEKTDDTDNAQKQAVEKPKQPQEFFTLGSLVAADNKRFLVTLNSQGGTVRRVEVASRKKTGRLAYRDLEHDGGYIGQLECEPEGPCRVRSVGPGTPAEIAGIEVGDTIIELDGQPIVSRADLVESLKDRRTGESVAIKVARSSDGGDTELALTVEFTDKPLELLSPSISITTGASLPESFLLTLHQCKDVEPSRWIEIDNGMETDNWKGERRVSEDGTETVEFRYVIPAEKLRREEIGLDGPLTAIKTYSLKPIEGEDEFGRSWHFSLDLRFESSAKKSVEFAYELGGPTGATIEGYWYQIKINGSGSFFGMAGARDLTSETDSGRFSFLDNPNLVKNQRKAAARQKPQYLFDPYASEELRTMKYFGVDTQYFNVSLLPSEESEEAFVTDGGYAWPLDPNYPKSTREDKRVDCSGAILKKVKLKKKKPYQQKFDVFAGPKESELLASYDLGNNMAFGWFSMFSKPLLWLLHLLYFLTFKITYAIPVILLTVMVRCIMIPISRKAALNAQMMQYLSPQIKELKEKYPDDMQKQMQAQQALFRKHKYNPFSGCLMGFIQLPIFLGLYRGLSADVALRDQPLIPGMSWCSNLAAPDQFLRWDSWMPSFLAAETGWLGPYLNILPLLTIALFVANAKMFTPPPTDEQQAMMQKMMTYMMFFMGFLFFKVPSALCLYFITSSIWGIAERQLLPKPKLDTSKLEAMDLEDDDLNTLDNGPLSNKSALEDRKRRDKERKRRKKERERD